MKTTIKRVINLTVALALTASSAHADYYTEKNPQAIASLKTRPLGTEFLLGFPDGSVRRVRVTALEERPNGAMKVTFDQTRDPIIVDFSEDAPDITFEPAPRRSAEIGDREVLPRPGHTSHDYSYGASASVIAGLQFALVTNSKAARTLEKYMNEIKSLADEMGADFDKIESARLSVADKILIIDKMLPASDSKWAAANGAQHLTRAGQIAVYGPDAAGAELSDYEWLSDDPEFIEKAESTRQKLLKARPTTPLKKEFYSISKAALISADQTSSLGDAAGAGFLLNVATTAADVLVGLDPFTGVVRSIYESVTGKNMITGDQLSGGERALAVLGVVTAGYAMQASRAFKGIVTISKKIAPKLGKSLDAAKKFLQATGHVASIEAKAGQVSRKIQLTSKTRADWGMNDYHLDKHFSGDSRFALKNIDPSGNMDKWMDHMTELAGRPVTSTTKNGMLDIKQSFAKADGSGEFIMGIRLAPLEDGTFDLITVLTDQTRGLK